MRTEESIVDELLNIYYGGEFTQDDDVNERVVRAFLRKHRASRLSYFTIEGQTVGSECFQELGTLTVERGTDGEYAVILPPLILLDYHGIIVQKDGHIIPVTDYFPYRLSKKNYFNKAFPKAAIRGHKLLVWPGIKDLCKQDASSEVYQTVSAFADEIAEFDDNEKITVQVDAVLYNPDDAPGYKWTESPYPCPSEIIDYLTTATASKDLQLMIRQHVDENINNLDDKVRTNEAV